MRWRIPVAGAAALVVFLVGTGTAAAKELPVTGLAVTTAHPVAGRPIEVVVDFAAGFALGNATAVTDFEISVLPAKNTGRDGWPRNRDHLGTPVIIHSVDGPASATEYRGTFVVRHAGRYVLVSRSGVYAHEDVAAGVTLTIPYVKPVRFRVRAPN